MWMAKVRLMVQLVRGSGVSWKARKRIHGAGPLEIFCKEILFSPSRTKPLRAV